MTEGESIFGHRSILVLRNRRYDENYFTKDGFCIPGAYGGR